MIRRLTAAIAFLLTVTIVATVGGNPYTAAGATSAFSDTDTNKRVLTAADSLKALEKLSAQIAQIVNLPEAKNGKVGIEIRSLASNKVLYTLNADKPLTPASTTKIVTAFTALSELGPNYQVKTVVAGDYKPSRDGILKGNLYVKGYGDPFLAINDIDVLVDQIVNSGIKQIEGNIVGDGSFFDEKIERTQYSGDADVVVPLPPIHALTLERSVFTVVISSPRIPGQPLNVQTYPPSAGLEIINNAVTASAPKRAPARSRAKKKKKRSDLLDGVKGPHAIDDGMPRFGDESPENYSDVIVDDASVDGRTPKKTPVASTPKRGTKKSNSKATATKKQSGKKTTTARATTTAKKTAAKTKQPATTAKKTAAKAPAQVKESKKAPAAEPVAPEKRGPIRVTLSAGENGRQVITVNGTLAPNRTVSYRYQMKNPPIVVAGIIFNRLKSHGITIGGSTVSGVTPAKHRVLAETGRPLLDILQYVMKNSNNFLAEYVFKIIGGAAGGQDETAEKTVEKIHYRMSVNKVPFGACIINDGSGLSRANCLSASALTAILDAAHNDRKLFDPFYSTMSIAGIDGTLRKRMKGTRAEGNVHGKTGTLRNVSALAGYVTTRDGEVLCFSMLMNGGNHGAYRSVQDKVAAQLAAFSYSQALASPSASVPSASVTPK